MNKYLIPETELKRNYEELAVATVRQATCDWRHAARRLKKCPTDQNAMRLKRDAERFFLSEWCYELGGVDGSYILMKLRKEQED